MIKQIDLLPVSYMIGNAIRRRTRKWMIVLVACIVLILGTAASIRINTTALEVELLPLKEKIGRGPVREMEMAQIASELRTTMDQKTSMDTLEADPFWSGLLADIAECVTDDMWLMSVDVSRKSGDDAKRPNAEVTITGHAATNEDILAFYQALKSSEHTMNVNLREARLNEVQDGAMYFEVVMKAV